jgi:hypothetical protein
VLLLRRLEVRRALEREALRWAVERLERLCVLERLGLDRLVEPDRAGLERFAEELDRAERLPPLLPPPRRCASAIVGRVVPRA